MWNCYWSCPCTYYCSWVHPTQKHVFGDFYTFLKFEGCCMSSLPSSSQPCPDIVIMIVESDPCAWICNLWLWIGQVAFPYAFLVLFCVGDMYMGCRWGFELAQVIKLSAGPLFSKNAFLEDLRFFWHAIWLLCLGHVEDAISLPGAILDLFSFTLIHFFSFGHFVHFVCFPALMRWWFMMAMVKMLVDYVCTWVMHQM